MVAQRIFVTSDQLQKIMIVLYALCACLYLLAESKPGPITVAIIESKSTAHQDRLHTMSRQHANDFIKSVFHPNPIQNRQRWTPIITENCEGVHFRDATSFNKAHPQGFQRGLILAHRQIWEDFWRSHKDLPSNISVYESPKLVVFESDAMEIDPIVHQIGYESIVNMTSDYHVLGLCYDRQPGVEIPECSHAYAMTVKCSKIFFDNIDHCARNGPLDAQVKELGRQKAINWTSVPASFPFGINNDYIMKKATEIGFTVEYGNQIGGLFYQVRFDNIEELVDGRLYAVQWPHNRQIYICQNETLRRFPDMVTFAKMGYDIWVNVTTVIPYFQLQRSIGDPLPSLIKPKSPVSSPYYHNGNSK